MSTFVNVRGVNMKRKLLSMMTRTIHRNRYFATLAKQEKLPTVLPPQSASAEIAHMELTEMNVTTVYLETYNPILRDLRNNLDEVNKQYVQKSISLFGWSNTSAKIAQNRINQLSDEINTVSEKLSSFCNRVNNASNDNFNKLFENINALTNKLETETVDKQRIIQDLKEQQQLVGKMKQDINLLQVSLEDTRNELNDKVKEYNKLSEEHKAMEADVEQVNKELKLQVVEFDVLSANFENIQCVLQDTKVKLQTVLDHIAVLETDIDNLKVSKEELTREYRKYKRRDLLGFIMYTAIVAGAVMWFYTVKQEEAESHVKKLEIKKESMEKIFGTKQEELEDTLKQKGMEVDALKKQLDVANSRGLWYYIFG